MRVVDQEDFEKTLLFLNKEASIDKENLEVVNSMDLTHMATNKKTGKLTGESEKRIKVFQGYSKNSKALIKKYKETNSKTKIHEKYTVFGRKKTWIRTKQSKD